MMGSPNSGPMAMSATRTVPARGAVGAPELLAMHAIVAGEKRQFSEIRTRSNAIHSSLAVDSPLFSGIRAVVSVTPHAWLGDHIQSPGKKQAVAA
jgi:hypothetical protein